MIVRAGAKRITVSWAQLISSPRSSADLLTLTRRVLAELVQTWTAGKMTDQGAASLNLLVRDKVLSTSFKQQPALKVDVEAYRALAQKIKLPTRVPGVIEGQHGDQALFVRGDIKKPGDTVPRRFLEVFGGKPYRPKNSGRLELARDIIAPGNKY